MESLCLCLVKLGPNSGTALKGNSFTIVDLCDIVVGYLSPLSVSSEMLVFENVITGQEPREYCLFSVIIYSYNTVTTQATSKSEVCNQ